MTMMQYLLTATTETPLLGSATKPEAVIDMDFQKILKQYITTEYGGYVLRDIIQDQISFGHAAVELVVKTICDSVYESHDYTYQHLFDTTVIKYNPINNYDMIEKEKTENSGVDTETHSLGKREDVTEVGAYTNTTDHGARKETYNNGATVLTDNYGQRVKESDGTGDVAPFESQNYQHVDKAHDKTTDSAVEDSHTQSAVENTVDFNKYQDKNNISAHTDKFTSQAREDKEVTEHGHVIERELKRSGNVGVTTSQQMLESERQLSMFNFTRIVANDLIHALCVCYEGVY